MLSMNIYAQSKKETVDYELSALVEAVNKVIKTNYVFPEIANDVADKIKESFKNGIYDKLEKGELAKAISKDIRDVSNDKHNVFVDIIRSSKNSKEASSQLVTQYESRLHNNGIEEVNILPGNIGYFKYNGFDGLKASKKGLQSAFELLKNVDALIFDLSDNRGGSPSTVQFISSFFFSNKTLLNRQHWRKNNEVTELWSLDLPNDYKFDEIPVVIIVSGKTASAAESFSYIMKHNKKATIIGSRTSGGAHMAEVFTIENDFLLQLSIGRAVNPITDSNWEGNGVQPNIESATHNIINKSRELLINVLIKKTSDEEMRGNYVKVLKTIQPKK